VASQPHAAVTCHALNSLRQMASIISSRGRRRKARSICSAFKPVLAVRAVGKSYVNSESTTANRGSMGGLRKLTLTRCSARKNRVVCHLAPVRQVKSQQGERQRSPVNYLT
jgi:hypothetical protein